MDTLKIMVHFRAKDVRPSIHRLLVESLCICSVNLDADLLFDIWRKKITSIEFRIASIAKVTQRILFERLQSFENLTELYGWETANDTADFDETFLLLERQVAKNRAVFERQMEDTLSSLLPDLIQITFAYLFIVKRVK